MKTKSILLLVLIASAMIKVFVYFVFVFVLILAIIQDQALVASKHLLVETEDANHAEKAGMMMNKVSWFIWVCVLHCSIDS